MTKTPAFKPVEISRDLHKLRQLEKEAKDKLDLLEEAQKEATKHASIDNLKGFVEDFTQYTTKRILANNKAFEELNLRDEKVLDLLDIDLSKLAHLQIEFEQNKAKLYFNDKGEPFTKIEDADYIHYTENQDQNDKLKTINNFIKSLDDLGKLITVQEYHFARATSGLLYVDMASSTLKVNKEVLKKI